MQLNVGLGSANGEARIANGGISVLPCFRYWLFAKPPELAITVTAPGSPAKWEAVSQHQHPFSKAPAMTGTKTSVGWRAEIAPRPGFAWAASSQINVTTRYPAARESRKIILRGNVSKSSCRGTLPSTSAKSYLPCSYSNIL